MGIFARQLEEIIAADFDNHRANFAKACRLSPGAMTNFLSKGYLPAPATMGRIARKVNDESKRTELIRAYFLDTLVKANLDRLDVLVRNISMTPDCEADRLIGELSSIVRRDASFRQLLTVLLKFRETQSK